MIDLKPETDERYRIRSNIFPDDDRQYAYIQKVLKADRMPCKSIQMSRERVRHILPELKRLNRLKDEDRRKYLKICCAPFVDNFCECIRNLLKGRVPIKPKHLKVLLHYKNFLRKASSKKSSRKLRRRLLQTGGFLSAILPTLVSGLSALIGTLFNRDG